MNKDKKVYGFQTGKHRIDIEAENEQKAFVIFAKKFFSFIDFTTGVSMLGERTSIKTKAA